MTMSPNHHNPPMPARRIPTDGCNGPQSDIRTSIGFLPKSDAIDKDEKISIARDENYDPTAIGLALDQSASTTTDKLRLAAFAAGAAVLVLVFFPFYRFFKPAPRDAAPMSIGGPVVGELPSDANGREGPWMGVLITIDRLYFQEGKLTEAIETAQSALAGISQKDMEAWHKVYYRYWELLADAGRSRELKTSTGTYLTSFPEDPFANYYYARALLLAAENIPTLDPESKAAYRREAEKAARQINATCHALDARKEHPQTGEKKKAFLAGLYAKLRLEQARLYVLIWQMGGYEEDRHPDVVYRDKALDITESEMLADMREAKALQAEIYRHILDRWYWFEGRQIIQNRSRKRSDLRQKLEALIRELDETKKNE